jgi:tetratricopeptide (TPR) repeat protein
MTRSPGVRAIRSELTICRALRPLHRRVPSPTETRPDEPTTADWIAQTGLWIPSEVPVAVRWLDVALVVDDSESMSVWQQTVFELRGLLQQTGAFRDVRVWHMDGDLRHGPTLTVSGATRDEVARRDPREVVDSAGRRLVLVVSDCVGNGWGSGAVAPALETWARSGPTAILQMLPQRLWVDCAPEFAAVRIHNSTPGASNDRLAVRSRDGDIDPAKAGVAVPVLQLEERWLRPWASMVAAAGGHWMHGVALFTGLIADHDKADAPEAHQSQLSPPEQLKRFRAHASPEAYQLSLCFAAAPLSLPVMRLIQEAILPTSKPSHLAEVFLSGLLRRQSEDSVEFDFQPGVRSELLAELARHDALHVLSTVSAFVSDHLGSPLDFLALLTKDGPGQELNGLSLPFARVAIDVLRSLGGRYSEAATRLTRMSGARYASNGAQDRLPIDSGRPLIDRGEALTSSPTTSAERETLPEALLPGIMRGVPPRNPHFTGRNDLLRRLRKRLVDSTVETALVPHALHGLGGVGKTQLAVEYVYRYAGAYDLVWWVSADDLAQVRASFVELGAALGLPEHPEVDRTVDAVLDVLRVGQTYRRWLLVFDNADHPGDLERYLPYPTGDVLITSRNVSWSERAATVEVDVLDRPESISLLRERVPSTAYDDADRLAERLGDLPLALEQAAAWLGETGMSVAEYLDLFETQFEQLTETPPLGYPAAVGATYQLALDRLKERSLSAAQLLDICAFLGPAPISVALLREGLRVTLPTPLSQTLRDTVGLRRLVREIGRYALAKLNAEQDEITVHRLVQLVVRAQLTDEERAATQVAAQRILAQFSPGSPDRQENWQRHAELSPHILPSGLIKADDVEARRVVLDQIRYRFVRGDYQSSQELAQQAVEVWEDKWGRDEELTLIANRHLANALRSVGEVEQARTLALDTWTRMRRVFGDDHEHAMYTADNVSWDLRISGDFQGALRIDDENLERCRRVLGSDDAFTLKVANNRAIDLRSLGEFRAARDADEESIRRRTAVYGPEDHNTLLSVGSLARDLYGLGDYAEGLALQERALPIRRRILGDRHGQVLVGTRTLVILLRKSGELERARKTAAELCDVYEQMFGPNHEHRLAGMLSYHNVLRSIGDLATARRIGEDMLGRYQQVFGEDHPVTLACATNYAITLRLQNEAEDALALNEVTLAAFKRRLGGDHQFTLCCATNMANDMAALGRHDMALERSRETLAKSTTVRGEEHPYTYVCMLNTALDLRATGDEAAAAPLLDAAITGLTQRLGSHHPEVLAARDLQRGDCDIEPTAT